MCKKIIKVPLYNYFDREVTMDSKRAYSDWIFNITCPKCKEVERYQPNTYTLLYVPKRNKSVHFYCESCHHEAYSFFLEDIVDGHALIYKNPDFNGEITISQLVEQDVEI